MRKRYSWFHKGTLNCLLDIIKVILHKTVTILDCVSSVIAVKKKFPEAADGWLQRLQIN